jgi:hypothetical protein
MPGGKKEGAVSTNLLGRLVERSPGKSAAGKPIESRSKALQELARRLQAEYAEMPGLNMTLAQAQRLLASDRQTCTAALKMLITRRVLRRTAQGRYVRCDP